MSRGHRIGLVLAALGVAVAAFLLLNPGSDELDKPKPLAETTTTETGTGTETGTDTATEAEAPSAPAHRISIAQGAVEGGAKTITAERGQTVRVIVSSDTPDELHLHGFDITRAAALGEPARFKFKASIEGSFEMESHSAEDAGRDPLVARVVVEPK